MSLSRLHRREFLSRTIAASALALVAPRAWAVEAAPTNLVLMLADGLAPRLMGGVDLGLGGFLGSATRFSRAYLRSASPASASAMGSLGAESRLLLQAALEERGYRTRFMCREGECAAEAERFVLARGPFFLAVDVGSRAFRHGPSLASGHRSAHMGANVGRMLRCLDRVGVADRTLVALLGGPDRDSFTCEGALHVPLAIRWPGVSEPGSLSEALVSTADLVPTLLDAASYPSPRPMGVSLRRPLGGDLSGWRRVLCSEVDASNGRIAEPRRSIRDERFRLIHSLLAGSRRSGSPEFELYDLSRDRMERRDLAGDTRYRAVELALRWRLESWRERIGDPLLDPQTLRDIA